MSASEIRRELERLAGEAEAGRARLAELREKTSAACDLVAAIGSMLEVKERTPPAEATQEEPRAQGAEP
jgi:hypothetical protein